MRGALLVALALAAPAAATERRVYVGSFDRIRVEGPFQVTVVTGRSPGAVATGDPRLLERLEVRLDGTTLVVRNPLDKWQDQPQVAGATPVAVALFTPVLSAASVIGGGTLAIAGGKAPRLDLSVAGAGSIAWTGADTDQVNATVIGTGAVTLAGRASRARLLVNGTGIIHADRLDAGELVVRVDGPGETTARARYTASVTNTGLGHVAIAGTPKCDVHSAAGGPVTCGTVR